MDPQLKAQLKETIYVATASGADAAGDSTYNAPASRLARVVDVVDTSENTVGGQPRTQVRSRKVIITEAAINLTDRVWLPGIDQTDASLARIPHYVEKAVDEKGNLDFFRTTV